MRSKSIIVLGIFLFIFSPSAFAEVILDANFFSTIPHSLVTFETDGSGLPVLLMPGESRSMPYDEYAALGFTFNPSIKWVNDSGFSTDAAQAIGGSPHNGIPSALSDDYFIHFSVPVRAFGFWVTNNSTVPEIPTFEAYGANGLIETVQFTGAAIDGTIRMIEYGFLGIMADQDITDVHTTKDATMFDNFMYSAVPEPATLLLLGLGAVILRRKK